MELCLLGVILDDHFKSLPFLRCNGIGCSDRNWFSVVISVSMLCPHHRDTELWRSLLFSRHCVRSWDLCCFGILRS